MGAGFALANEYLLRRPVEGIVAQPSGGGDTDERIVALKAELNEAVEARKRAMADFSRISPMIGIFSEIRSIRCANAVERFFAKIFIFLFQTPKV